MNTKNLKKYVNEFKNGDRCLCKESDIIIKDDLALEGFTLFPVKKDEVELIEPEKSSGRVFEKDLTVEQAKQLSKNMLCTNKETINAFFSELESKNEKNNG